MPASACTGPTRRAALQLGALGALGLPHHLRLSASESGGLRPPLAQNKACILLFLGGGPPQHETWDPKPDAPAEVRGEHGVIRTATPGLIVGERMPLTARLTDRIAVLRACQTNDNAHSASGYYMTTGVPHQPMQVENAKPGAPNDWPSLGAVVRLVKQPGCRLPAAVTLPAQAENDGGLTWPGQDGGFLGRAADPWLISCDPSKPQFDVPGLTLPPEVPVGRFASRQSLLDRLDADADASPYLRRAVEMIATPAARRAFRLDEESPRTRDRYGRGRYGQSVLLARRLVEAGVPFVRVNWVPVAGAPNGGSWDTHQKNTEGVDKLLPVLDAAYSALLEDLADRGMLDSTLVVWTAEFGRTPRINPAAGRDHWGPVFSSALAGGGVRGGAVYGSSDKLGAFPKDGRVTPPDLHATILHALGVPPETEMRDALGRPLPVCRGEPVRAILKG